MFSKDPSYILRNRYACVYTYISVSFGIVWSRLVSVHGIIKCSWFCCVSSQISCWTSGFCSFYSSNYFIHWSVKLIGLVIFFLCLHDFFFNLLSIVSGKFSIIFGLFYITRCLLNSSFGHLKILIYQSLVVISWVSCHSSHKITHSNQTGNLKIELTFKF